FTQKVKLEISKNKLIKRKEMIALADKYKEQQRAITDKTVDENEAKATVKKEDYKQYDVQYIYIDTTDVDDKTGESVDLDKKTLEKREKLLEDAYEKVTKEDKKISKVVDDKDGDITYETDTFTEADGWDFTTQKSVLKKIKALDKGEVSEILEDKENGCKFFVKMKDNNNTKSYDEACETAVTEAKDKAYDKWYATLQKKYPVKVNDDLWEDVEFGTVTTSIVTLADIEKIAKKKEKIEAKESASAEAASKAAAKKEGSEATASADASDKDDASSEEKSDKKSDKDDSSEE
ncbi:MAG: hypothetical protein K6D02_06650, partial [Lachnospiraceae bacterium]|nr:hypothetical protein [Lachnospiraceae bacterium]